VVQIGVATLPGSTSDTAMPHGRSSARKRIAQRCEGRFRGVIRSDERHCYPPADRTDIHDPAASLAQQRQQAAWVIATGPNTFTSNCRRTASRGEAPAGRITMPALFTSPASPVSPTIRVTSQAAAHRTLVGHVEQQWRER
jgi:hypothetical protein